MIMLLSVFVRNLHENPVDSKSYNSFTFPCLKTASPASTQILIRKREVLYGLAHLPVDLFVDDYFNGSKFVIKVKKVQPLVNNQICSPFIVLESHS